MNEFYMILSSNTNGAGNQPNKFTTTLKTPINFNDSQKFSMALTKMLYTTTSVTFLGSEHLTGSFNKEKNLLLNKDFILKNDDAPLRSGGGGSYRIQITSPIPKNAKSFALTQSLLPDNDTGKSHFRSRKELEDHEFILNHDHSHRQVSEYAFMLMRYKKNIDITMKPALYTSVKDIKKMLNKTCNEEIFDVDGNNLKLVLKGKSWIKMSPQLSYTLGFDMENFGVGTFIAKNPPRFQYHADSMFVYTDIVDYSPTGDENAPLLQLIPFQKSKPMQQSSWNAFNEMMIPIRNQLISQISIEIRTSTGELFPFMDNTNVQLVLHFKNFNNI